MNEPPISTFKDAIRATHGAEAELVARVAVHERFQGATMWRGEVFVFDLQGHPTASRCYAWQDGSQITAVLHTGPVDSPANAVRASFLAADKA